MHKLSLPLEVGVDPETNMPVFGVTVESCFIFDPYISECGRFAAEPEDYGMSDDDAQALLAMNRALADGLEVALAGGCLALHTAMGIGSGDTAGVFFSNDETKRPIAMALQQYLMSEYNAAGGAT